MGFLSLYRKYRPEKFSDLVGQEYIVRTLRNALKNDRIVHAYLFAGPRGTGKTSTAKVFAKALNCEDKTAIEPCTECSNCKKIEKGQSIDVIEIDAASNRGIDEIRELREKVKFYPGEGEYKVYIIDEVHMLTKGAFNALLKTLEEPPENVVFILATTEPHQIITTILSRCQRFDFSLLSVSEIVERLTYICKNEGVDYEEDALNLIAHSSNGGLRDAISILDQGISYTDGSIETDDISQMLGKIDKKILSQFIRYVINNNTGETLKLINELVERGKEVSRFVNDLTEHCRQLLLIKQCGIDSGLLEFSLERQKLMKKESKAISESKLLRMIDILTEIDRDLKFSNQPQLIVEMSMVEITSPEANTSLNALQDRISSLEYKLQQLETGTGKSEISKPETTESSSDSIPNSQQGVNQSHTSSTSKEKREEVETDSETQNKGLDIKKVRKAWPQVLSKIKKEDIQTQAYLIEGKPVSVSENIISIEFSPSKRFHKKCAEKKKQFITKIFNQVLKGDCRLKFTIKGEENTADNVSHKERQEKKQKENKSETSASSGSSENEELVKEVADLFDGEIIKADENFIDN